MHRILLLGALALVANDSALAHTGGVTPEGFFHGLTHPVTGLDHVLAMLAVGLFGTMPGGRAVWLVPLSFIATMIAGCMLGLAAVTVPFPELGIALSVIVLGAVIAFRVGMPLAAAMALTGFFAIFHGFAHGAEMPESASGIAYGAGFVLATGALHAAGVGVGIAAARLGRTGERHAVQGAGALIAMIGVMLLTVAV